MASRKDMRVKAADIFGGETTNQKVGNALAAPCMQSKPEITDLYIARDSFQFPEKKAQVQCPALDLVIPKFKAAEAEPVHSLSGVNMS